LDRPVDDRGYLLMDGFPDREAAGTAEADPFQPPPPLAESDWLVALSRAVSTPVDHVPFASDHADDLTSGTAEAPGAPAPVAGELGDAGPVDWTPSEDAGASSASLHDAAADGCW
jgi:hypothetical protein